MARHLVCTEGFWEQLVSHLGALVSAVLSPRPPPKTIQKKIKGGPVPWLVARSALWFLGASVAESLGATWSLLGSRRGRTQVPWLVSSLQVLLQDRDVCNTRKLTHPCTFPCFTCTCTAALPYLVSLALLQLAFPALFCTALFVACSCTADRPTVFLTLTVAV